MLVKLHWYCLFRYNVYLIKTTLFDSIITVFL